MRIKFFGKWYRVVSINFYDDQVALIYKGDETDKLLQMHINEFKSMEKDYVNL